jgi:N-acetylglucosaminyldiphosphoundecaprenol N-acetyl-beta-D-mannosaminyltransferase
MNHITLTGIKVTNCTKDELNGYICQVIRQKRKEVIPNVNIHCMNLCADNPWLQEFLNSCEVVVCDGDGVRLGAWISGSHIQAKITYNRWIWDLAQLCITNGLSLYLLGSRSDVIEKAVRRLERRYPDLRIVGFHSGYIADKSERDAVIADINRSKPNILIVGMGMPLQEKWLLEHMSHLHVNVALTGGAVFDYVGGIIRTTPDLLYKMKLEWLFRLLGSPLRLFRRYVIGNPLFVWRVVMHHWFHVSAKQEDLTDES